MNEELLKDEFEQALKRRNKDYADGYVEGLKDGYNQANPVENRVMQKIAEIKQKIKEHFDSENIILDNAKTEMSDKEYEYRKVELGRQRFYIMLILSNFTA